MAGDRMKRFITRGTVSDGFGFVIYDELGKPVYNAAGNSEMRKQQLLMTDVNGKPISWIAHKDLVLQYFSIRCSTGYYVLLPVIKECFSFVIYGSSFHFAGDLASGRFSLFDVDKSPVMTLQKSWSGGSESFEAVIYREDQEIFSLSSAICAIMYLACTEEKAVLN